MNKSLTPLIVLFALIILATIIIINTWSTDEVVDYNQNKLLPAMELSSFRPIRRQPRPARAPRRRRHDDNDVDMNTEKMIDEARAHMLEGKMDLAEDTLRTLLVFEPDNLPALSLLGGIFYSSGRYAEAETIFDRQLRLNPDDLAPRGKLFKVLRRQDKFAEAMTVAKKALDIAPGSAAFMLKMARMYAVTGDIDEALKYLDTAAERLGPKFLSISFDSDFDRVRLAPEFQRLLENAERLRQNQRGRDELIRSIPETAAPDSPEPNVRGAP